MTGLVDVDELKICIQVCVWLGFPPLKLSAKRTNKLRLMIMMMKEEIHQFS